MLEKIGTRINEIANHIEAKNMYDKENIERHRELAYSYLGGTHSYDIIAHENRWVEYYEKEDWDGCISVDNDILNINPISTKHIEDRAWMWVKKAITIRL